MPPAPPSSSAVAPAGASAAVPGFLVAAAARFAELPVVLTERMVQGEPAPSSEADAEARRKALQAKGWAVAQGQGAQLLQVGFMLYFMVGSRLNLWSIFYLVLMGSSPFRNLLGVNAAFAPFAMPGVDLGAAKLLYTALNLAGCGVFFWKLNAMGLMRVRRGRRPFANGGRPNFVVPAPPAHASAPRPAGPSRARTGSACCPCARRSIIRARSATLPPREEPRTGKCPRTENVFTQSARKMRRKRAQGVALSRPIPRRPRAGTAQGCAGDVLWPARAAALQSRSNIVQSPSFHGKALRRMRMWL